MANVADTLYELQSMSQSMAEQLANEEFRAQSGRAEWLNMVDRAENSTIMFSMPPQFRFKEVEGEAN